MKVLKKNTLIILVVGFETVRVGLSYLWTKFGGLLMTALKAELGVLSNLSALRV